jgi:FkbH-like protein
MKFLEAARIVRNFEGGPPLPFLLGTSGEAHPLDVFLRAAAAGRGREAQHRTLPFNTLGQALQTEPRHDETEVFLLFPWDLVPSTDWRSGIPSDTTGSEDLIAAATAFAELIHRRPRARVAYVDAPIPAVLSDSRLSAALRHQLVAVSVSLGAEPLGGEVVSMAALFEHGLAIAPASLGRVASLVVEMALREPAQSSKVLVTDFDNTLWKGVVGEVGVAGLAFTSAGLGFPHFVYQTYLRRLRLSGALLAGVTKNDPDLAIAPLQSDESVLGPDDFVSIVASYNPKSAQIAELANQLNLGLDSFVFVDDNPVELAEVGAALPTVRTLQFPGTAEGLPAFVQGLSVLFHRETVTTEDQDRTAMYRRRLAGMVPKDVEGSDLTEFLRDLRMRLTIRDRSARERDRAVQLINKTNQFNLNGIRRSSEEVEEILQAGGRLFTAALDDRHGSHGEILSCLIDSDQVLRSFVMSCRVFERRVEHAFLAWLAVELPGSIELEFVETERNEPIRRFFRDPAFSNAHGRWTCDLETFARGSRNALDLFELHDEGAAPRDPPTV